MKDRLQTILMVPLTAIAAYACTADVGSHSSALSSDGDVELRAEALTLSSSLGAHAEWEFARVILTDTSTRALTWSVGTVSRSGAASGYLREIIDPTGAIREAEILDASGGTQCHLSGGELRDSSGALVMELVSGAIYHAGTSVPSYSFAADGVYAGGARLVSTSADQSLTSDFRRLLIGALLDGACGLPAAPVDSVTTGPQPMTCESCTGRCQIVNVLTSQIGAEVDVGGGQSPSQCLEDIADACEALDQWGLTGTCGW